MTDIAIKRNFGLAVRKRRGELGISQEELGGRAGLHRTYITDIERGARNVSLKSIMRLSKALDISMPELMHAAAMSIETEPPPWGCRGDRQVQIVLVEDDPHDVDLTVRTFAKARIANAIRVFADGVEALEFVFSKGKFASQARFPQPLLLLLDLNLPKVSGLEVLRRIKSDERAKLIRVVILTASGRDRDITECRKLGADGYLVKPIGAQHIIEVTRKLNFDWALVEASS